MKLGDICGGTVPATIFEAVVTLELDDGPLAAAHQFCESLGFEDFAGEIVAPVLGSLARSRARRARVSRSCRARPRTARRSSLSAGRWHGDDRDAGDPQLHRHVPPEGNRLREQALGGSICCDALRWGVRPVGEATLRSVKPNVWWRPWGFCFVLFHAAGLSLRPALIPPDDALFSLMTCLTPSSDICILPMRVLVRAHDSSIVDLLRSPGAIFQVPRSA